jgi:methylenetetrahydrofolate dehydrogenase (NADP+) / methenyltetrahydrofolate cyclohydrolase
MTLLDGKAVQQTVLERIKETVEGMSEKPGLAVVLVGEDPASQVYVANKEKACTKVGFYSEKIELPATTTREELLAVIDRLNRDTKIHGILCQFPLPQSLKEVEDEVIRRIDPRKDVDGFHPVNVGELATCTRDACRTGLIPCTPKGIMVLMQEYGIELAGKHAVVVGRSNLVGKPVSLLLLAEDATVTMTHSKTNNLAQVIQMADVVVAAVGKPEFVKGEWIKPGAVVIDVGINRTDHGLVGDVEYEAAKEKAAFITPVPGGVGPMTIAMLMDNVMKAFGRSK